MAKFFTCDFANLRESDDDIDVLINNKAQHLQVFHRHEPVTELLAIKPKLMKRVGKELAKDYGVNRITLYVDYPKGAFLYPGVMDFMQQTQPRKIYRVSEDGA